MSDRRLDLVIGLLLVVVTLTAYGHVTANDFIDLDDPVYVTRNPMVSQGLTKEGLRWAWTTLHAGYWQPLTWMSLQLDAQLYGLNPAGFHLTNLLLHGANVVLLFGVLRGMTGAVGRSAVVAALFAVHPLHVESVAWVAERKDVLSTLGGLLTLAAYARYAAWPSVGRYLVVVWTLTLGLLAKPMLVTLPCVLLLLDYWPLGRFSWGGRVPTPGAACFAPASPGRLVLEKLPLLAVAVAFGLITVFAHERVEGVVPLEQLPLDTRLATALVGYVDYLRSTIWPTRLGAFYPYPSGPRPWIEVAGAALLLAGITAVVVRAGRRRPYLPVGWLWFLGMLVPVSGLVQAGEQARADRFTYLPNIGLYVMAAWGLGEWAARRRSAVVPAGITLLALAACLLLTRRQVAYWQNGVTLWRHTLTVTEDNYQAHYSLGMTLVHQGEEEKGVRELYRALAIRDMAPIRKSLGTVLLQMGRTAEAAEHLKAALQFEPESAETHNALGAALFQEGDAEGARAHLREALRLQPDYTLARLNLAQLLDVQAAAQAEAGRFDEAVKTAEEALKLLPADQHPELARQIRGRLELYRKRQPFREQVPGQASP